MMASQKEVGIRVEVMLFCMRGERTLKNGDKTVIHTCMHRGGQRERGFKHPLTASRNKCEITPVYKNIR